MGHYMTRRQLLGMAKESAKASPSKQVKWTKAAIKEESDRRNELSLLMIGKALPIFFNGDQPFRDKARVRTAHKTGNLYAVCHGL